MHAMSPASVSVIESIPKVTATEQQEQLVKFISRDDPFALSVLKEYCAMFLRMKGMLFNFFYFLSSSQNFPSSSSPHKKRIGCRPCFASSFVSLQAPQGVPADLPCDSSICRDLFCST